jgi:hypothetical protein
MGVVTSAIGENALIVITIRAARTGQTEIYREREPAPCPLLYGDHLELEGEDSVWRDANGMVEIWPCWD